MLQTGEKAADFELPTPENKKVKLSSRFKDAPVMVVFYKYNCPTCQYTFTHLPRIARELGNEHFIAVAQDTESEAADFKKKYGFDFDVVSDNKPYAVSNSYGTEYVPSFFIVEADGKISLSAEGFDKKAIENFAQRLAQLKGKSNYAAFDPSAQVPLLKPG